MHVLLFWSKKKTVARQDDIVVSLVIQSLCITWFITKIVCWKLWMAERLFPLAPPVDFFIAPQAVHLLLFCFSLCLMLVLIFKPLHKKLQVFLFITEVLACLLDQSRWQPWEYQFIFILFINISTAGDKTKILSAVAFIMICTYVYSGIGKFNQGFLYIIWDQMFLKRFFKLSTALIQTNIVHYSGYIMAITELVMGTALFFKRTQKTAAWLLILMHLFILVVVGPFPFSLHYNTSVWPWNILMIFHLYILFINRQQEIKIERLWIGWTKLVVILWGIMPLLNHTLGWWDNFLSSRLFAGNQPQMVLCIKDSAELKQLQPYLIKNDPYKLCDGTAYVHLQLWSMKELNSPCYIEERVYKKVSDKWISTHTGSSTKAILYYIDDRGKITNSQSK
ncbi:MAG: hypothetical protein QM791_12125 [Ferruginibacter sp.]